MAPEEVYISSVPNVKEGEGEEQWIKKSSLKAWRLVLPQKKKKEKKETTADHDVVRGGLKDNAVHLISNQIQVSGAGLRKQTWYPINFPRRQHSL